jgi:DNA-binding NtrC family response regulator
MRVLIVEANADLGSLWARHIERQGNEPVLVAGADAAFEAMRLRAPEVIVADLDLAEGGALAVADYAAYRHPDARVIFVTASSFFSDGSVFQHSPNACAFLPLGTSPEDLAAVVAFHGARRASAG